MHAAPARITSKSFTQLRMQRSEFVDKLFLITRVSLICVFLRRTFLLSYVAPDDNQTFTAPHLIPHIHEYVALFVAPIREGM